MEVNSVPRADGEDRYYICRARLAATRNNADELLISEDHSVFMSGSVDLYSFKFPLRLLY
jgi:hypothetical protein